MKVGENRVIMYVGSSMYYLTLSSGCIYALMGLQQLLSTGRLLEIEAE